MSDLELDLKRLIVSSLILEDVTPEEMDSDAPLFGDGLGLDSIDALELGLAIDRTYGIKITSDDEGNRDRFRSVRTLAAFLRRELDRREASEVPRSP